MDTVVSLISSRTEEDVNIQRLSRLVSRFMSQENHLEAETMLQVCFPHLLKLSSCSSSSLTSCGCQAQNPVPSVFTQKDRGLL